MSHILFLSSIFLALPKGGSRILLSLYSFAFLSPLMSIFLSLLYHCFLTFIIAHTSMFFLYPFALHLSQFVIPLEDNVVLSAHLYATRFPPRYIAFVLSMDHCHIPLDLSRRYLCLSLCSLNHERVLHLV